MSTWEYPISKYPRYFKVPYGTESNPKTELCKYEYGLMYCWHADGSRWSHGMFPSCLNRSDKVEITKEVAIKYLLKINMARELLK